MCIRDRCSTSATTGPALSSTSWRAGAASAKRFSPAKSLSLIHICVGGCGLYFRLCRGRFLLLRLFLGQARAAHRAERGVLTTDAAAARADFLVAAHGELVGDDVHLLLYLLLSLIHI